MKIIHCGDIHLDSKMTSNLSKEQARERKMEILRTFTRMVDYAKKRIKDHIGRFTRLYNDIKEDKIDEDFLEDIEEKDCVFPDIDYMIYS